MSKSQQEKGASGGLMTSAGLTTYYDDEKELIAFDPKTIMLFTLLMALFFTSIHLVF